jgi:biotin transporter BioY
VPLTGQTFAVLLLGAALGMKRAVLSQGLYWALGAVGLPFYAGGQGGWEQATGSTFGYFVGFVAAAAVVGMLAERGQDRSFVTALPAMLLGTVAIYAAGVSWLAYHLGVPFYAGTGKDAFTYGLLPFIAGDLIKLGLAAVCTPVAWRLLSRKD